MLLPEPLTPVTRHSTPSGNSTVMFCRLLPRAPARRIQPWFGARRRVDRRTATAAREKIAGQASRAGEHFGRRALKDDFAAALAAPGPISMIWSAAADHRLFVLDHDHRIAPVAQRGDRRRSAGRRRAGARPTDGSSST